MEKGIEKDEDLNLKAILKRVIEIERTDNYEKEIQNISNEIIKYYRSHNGRHLYSEVSAFFYNTNEEDVEYIFGNLEEIKKYLNMWHPEYEVNIYKLIDHIKLEQLRFEQLKLNQESNAKQFTNKIERKTKEYEEKFSLMGKKYKKQDKNFNKINKKYTSQKKSIDELNNQIISIIGIFSAIVITFFGGMDLLGSALNNMHNVSKYRIVFVILITAFAVFNIIFMLLYYVNRLIGKASISKLEQLKRRYIKEKYPIVYFYNCISLMLMLSLFIVFIIDKYNVISYILGFIHIDNKYNLIPICGLICFCIVISLFFLSFLLFKIIKFRFTKKSGKA